MKEFYKIKDIQLFLYERGILWNGIDKMEQSHNDMILADVKLFDKKGYKDVEVYLEISELDFNIFVENCSTDDYEASFSKSLLKDYTFDWIKTLIEKYPEQTPTINALVESRMKKIHNYYEPQISELQQRINEIREEQTADLSTYKEIRKLIKSTELNISSPKEEIITK